MRAGRMLVAVTVTADGLLAVFVVWALVRAPILTVMYGDVPPFRVATDLHAAISFSARILDRRRWSLRLVVYYDSRDAREAIEKLVGP